MLKYYYVYATTLRNNKVISKRYLYKIISEERNNYSDNITWDNLENYYYNNGLNCPFTVYNLKKGRVISFFDFKFKNRNTWDIREWKHPNLNIIIKYEYKENTHYSVDEILQYPNAEEAIAFLTQFKKG